MGAQGKPYVDCRPCRGGTKGGKDASIGWGRFCKDAHNGHAHITVPPTTQSPRPLLWPEAGTGKITTPKSLHHAPPCQVSMPAKLQQFPLLISSIDMAEEVYI